MSQKIIVVLGITGIQGGSVANTFLSLPGWKVRGITRDATKPSAIAWTSKDVELFEANVNHASSLKEAFSGATVIFCTTNFFDSFYNPATQSLLKPGQTVPEFCYEQEVQQIKNIAEAAAQVEGLERFIVSSLVDATKLSGGKYKGVYHFDAKAHAVEKVREAHPELAKKMSVVLPAAYMENWTGELKLMKGPDGGWSLALPGSGLRALPHIDIGRDLGNIVHAAVQAEPGLSILGASAHISWADMLKVWCEVNKVPFGGFHSLPVEVFAGYVPVPYLGLEIGEMMAFIDEFGYDGGDSSIVLASDLGVPLTSWEEYVKKQDWTNVLNG